MTAIQGRFPNLPQTWQLTKQLPTDNTQEKTKFLAFRLDEAMWWWRRGTWSCPTTVMQSTLTAGTRQRCYPFSTTTVSPQNILSNWLLLTAPHIYQDAAASVAPSMLSSTLPKASERSTLNTPGTWEKGFESRSERIWKAISITPLQISWGSRNWNDIPRCSQTRNLKGSRVMLGSKVWVRPQTFIHIFSFKNVKAVAALQLTAMTCIAIAKACKIWYTPWGGGGSHLVWVIRRLDTI